MVGLPLMHLKQQNTDMLTVLFSDFCLTPLWLGVLTWLTISHNASVTPVSAVSFLTFTLIKNVRNLKPGLGVFTTAFFECAK